MPRTAIIHQVEQANVLERLVWAAAEYDHYALLNSNDGTLRIGVGALDVVSASENSLDQLRQKLNDDWWFGFFSYNFKNEIEQLTSRHSDPFNAPNLFFFQPELVVEADGGNLRLLHQGSEAGEKTAHEFITKVESAPAINDGFPEVNLQPRESKEQYIENVTKLKAHIKRGDIYEVNYCQEFYSEDQPINAPATWLRLNALSEAPFSCLLRMGDLHIMSASPERFIKKEGKRLMSQPIKGTIRRGVTEQEDAELIEQLKNDPKERGENVMIVDLVRNDLSRTAAKNSVTVKELYGIYTFKTLHQMISTVVSELDENHTGLDAIEAAFPPGSMTGAPKISAMELINEHESFNRGIYSGTIGYFAPTGDFDFNVVIRTLLYNSSSNYLSFAVGGAITDKSDPEKEYNETLLKGEALINAFSYSS